MNHEADGIHNDTASQAAGTNSLDRPGLAKDLGNVTDPSSGYMFQGNILGTDQSPFGSSMPKVSHWSIAWSDLMMTMFILFLSMFVYQAAHKEFLVSDEFEIVGGKTSDAIEIAAEDEVSFPFVPIKPSRPIVGQETIRKVEPIKLSDIDTDIAFFDEENRGGLDRIQEELAMDSKPPATSSLSEELPKNTGAESDTEVTDDNSHTAEASARVEKQDQVNEIFSMSKDEISELGIEDFASVDLVPDKTMRIILTGDLLFKTGVANLSQSSINSLQRIAAVIKKTPYMVNVIGHTDNIPMSSDQFPTNWELSVARASTVARFLIEEMGMNPNQFIVSGYSSYRPMRPNTNARNRAVNRRVEIIISKRLPAPVPATAENIN